MTCAVSRIYRGDAADGSAGHRISSLYGTKRSCRHVYCGVGEINGLPAAGGGGRWVRRYLQHREKKTLLIYAVRTATTSLLRSHPIQWKARDGSRGLIRNGKARADIDLAQHVAVFV